MKHILNIVILLLTIPAFAIAIADANVNTEWDGWISRDKQPLVDTEYRKAKNGFGSILIITNETDFFEKWHTPSETFEYETLKNVEKGDYFIIAIIFINPGVSSGGNTDITYDVKITNPDGTTYANVPNLNVWNREPPKVNTLGLSERYLTIKMEPGDQVGKYKVETKVRDRMKNVEYILTRDYTVEE